MSKSGKMLASDFDRTFYVNCEITEANIRAVENWRQQGNLFVIATGREESILREKLEEKGYTVVLTRESDQGLYDDSAQNKKAQDMQRRIALIDETAPVLTVSIHQNSYHDPSVKGPQVFYYETSGEGKELAADLQESLNTTLEVERPREIKGNTSYYLLKRSKGVLVIAECGFLTNPDEADLLQTEEYQERVADALTDGIVTYLRKV